MIAENCTNEPLVLEVLVEMNLLFDMYSCNLSLFQFIFVD